MYEERVDPARISWAWYPVLSNKYLTVLKKMVLNFKIQWGKLVVVNKLNRKWNIPDIHGSWCLLKFSLLFSIHWNSYLPIFLFLSHSFEEFILSRAYWRICDLHCVRNAHCNVYKQTGFIDSCNDNDTNAMEKMSDRM